MNHFIPNTKTGKPALVIGSAGIDLIGRVESELKPATSNPAHIRRSYGGVARNMAENLARLGQPVRLISVVGEDKIGLELLEYTASAGVEVSFVLKSDEHSTGHYIGIVDTNGVLQFAVDNMHLLNEITPTYLREHRDLFKSASMVIVDANLPVKSLRTVISLAKRAKIPVCADPTSSTLSERLSQFLPKIHLLTCNSNEASLLTGHSFDIAERDAALEAGRALVNQGVSIALIALAEFGVVYATSETTGYAPAIRTRITDPTGAGDAMTAAVLFGLLNNIELDDAVRLGVAAASLTLRHPGSVFTELSLEGLYDQLLT